MREIEYTEVKLIKGGISFTWDDRKAKSNLKKHGVSFTEAALAFFDDNAVYDINSVDKYTGEERLEVIGMVYGDVMFLVYVERITIDGNDVIRIISAREATKEEEATYYHDNGHS